MRARWLLAFTVAVTAALPACVRPQLTECADGRVCPGGTICDVDHRSCVMPAQLDVCRDATNGTPCSTDTIEGACDLGVCIVIGCGNRVIEDGEECDDGNREDGDGCSAICASNEQCGNGVVDRTTGESCDDGDLVSRDGCSSQCTTETTDWQVADAAVLGGRYTETETVWDPGRNVLVAIYGGWSWEWNGVWTRTSTTAPKPSSSPPALFYDSTRMLVGVLYGGAGSTLNQVAQWDGQGWQLHALTGTAPCCVVKFTSVDPARGVLVVTTGNNQFYRLDLATWTWLPPVTVPINVDAFAIDSARNRYVLLQYGRRPCCGAPDTEVVTCEWDGMTTSCTQATPGSDYDWNVIFDPGRQQVIAIGGASTYEQQETEYTYPTDAIAAWNGTAWLPAGRLPQEGWAPHVWFEGLRLHVFGLYGAEDIIALDGTAWTRRTPPRPLTAGALAADPERGFVLALDYPRTLLWRDGSGWEVVQGAGFPVSPNLYGPISLVYDPDRRGVLAFVRETGAVWLFDGMWRLLPITPKAQATQVIYDYAARRLMLSTMSGTWYLPVGASDWVAGPGLPPAQSAARLAFDSGNEAVVAYNASGLYELINEQWVQTLSPGANLVLHTSLHARSLELFSTGTSWRRARGQWTVSPAVPWSGVTLVEGRAGQLLARHVSSGLDVIFERVVRGGAEESCATGEDADGDGASGCDDPDCWELCLPACPPGMSCAVP